MLNEKELSQINQIISDGGIIAYPTEAVYGLGCNPFDEKAVLQLLSIKQRPVEQGLILIASHVRQVLPLIKPLHADDLARALKTWPGHATWVFPKSALVPKWLSGKYKTIAVRVSKHPIVKQLCDSCAHPLVSTSANVSNQNQLDSINEIRAVFNDKIQFYIDEATGDEKKSSPIIDAHTHKTIR
jgi:L-threonylcarbamoyladenylate synthase